jgi:hypothetical protein
MKKTKKRTRNLLKKMNTNYMKKRYVNLFESWINEATTEASDDEIKKLLSLIVPIIKKSVDDTIRIELEFAEKLSKIDNDNERSKLFSDLNAKRDLAQKPISIFLSSRGKVSQSQMNKILSWSMSMKEFLFNKEMSTKEKEFKDLGADVSKWKEMYNPTIVNNQILIHNRDFEKETGIKPPLITG